MDELDLISHAFNLANLLAPVVVALLTVPILDGFKRIASFVDNLPAWAKQITAVFIAYGLTLLGEWAQTPLPETLHAFTGENVEALLSAGIAMAIHAGKKAADR